MEHEINPVILEDEDLSIWEKKIRDKFIEEYFIDFNYESAVTRTGFTGYSVFEYVNKFKRDPYVQRRIVELKKNTDIEDTGRTPRQSRIINGLMAEAFNHGPDASASSRISALTKLASIEGLDKPIQTEILHGGEIKNNFDFTTLSASELKNVRQLLESRVKSKNET